MSNRKPDHLDTARLTMPGQEEHVRRFADAAAKSFAEHPTFHSFSDGEIDPLLLALRWGVAGQAVLVCQLDEGFKPVIYGDAVTEHREKRREKVEKSCRCSYHRQMRGELLPGEEAP